MAPPRRQRRACPVAASPDRTVRAPTTLAARITLWEGAAGCRIAHVELTNSGYDATATSMRGDGRSS